MRYARLAALAVAEAAVQCEKVSTEQSKVLQPRNVTTLIGLQAVDGDSWPDFPQDSRCDGPAQLLNVR